MTLRQKLPLFESQAQHMNRWNSQFLVGHHRPVYLWAGPGTVRMNQLKFMGALNDIEIHAEAHTDIGARRVAQEAGFNWAYLMYDWGFPPEIEWEDWEDFKRAVPIFHAHGVKVFGYIQASNCVFAGSYTQKNWYAQTPRGSPTYYYTGRYMTCWQHPEWIEHLQQMVIGVVDSGADGVFFDNPWLGIQPLHFGGSWTGPAGCYCSRCRYVVQKALDMNIPTRINPSDDVQSRMYLTWRANLVSHTLASLADLARACNPQIVISANDYNAIMQPAYTTHGIDVIALAKIQDVLMIEDFALPRWSGFQTGKPAELVNNAITIRTATALAGDTPVTTDPYDKGIGFDDVYPPDRFQAAIAEAAACGTAMVVKGTEFIDPTGTFTLLTAPHYITQRAAIKLIHQWLAENADLFQDRTNGARIGLYYPVDSFQFGWDQIAPLYFAACQTLIYEGIPWRVVTSLDDHVGLDTLFCFHNIKKKTSNKLKIIYVPDVEGWSFPNPSFLSRYPNLLHFFLGQLLGWYYQSYFKYRWTRILTDRLGITQWFLRSPYFKIPPSNLRQSLLSSMQVIPYPHVQWQDAPVLVEVWDRENERQIHIVNYGEHPQPIRISFEQVVCGVILSPEHTKHNFNDRQVTFDLHQYAVILINNSTVS